MSFKVDDGGTTYPIRTEVFADIGNLKGQKVTLDSGATFSGIPKDVCIHADLVKKIRPTSMTYMTSSDDVYTAEGKVHRKKPSLPGIRRTRAGLDLYCRSYGGRCQTRTDTCRSAPCQPSNTEPVPVRHWPVLGQTGRPTGRQDRLPGRHMLRHCYSGRSQAGTNDMYL
jgi:hypothetical protein